ncbi:MAG: SurA N-terminal domain-containing protein [Synergistaceae bacterium]|nr:SurA N-terminal domain-containing protein [Synergistaceae bacterium]
MDKLRTQMRWIMVVIVVTFLLSTFLMYDSGPRRGASSSGQLADYAVADVNGRRLMRSALDQRVRQYIEAQGTRDLASTDLPPIYQSVLEQYAMEQQMTQEVKDSGIVISDADAEQAMKDYADQVFPTREAFYQSLERSGLKVEDYKKNIAQQMASQQLIRESIGVVTVSEDEAIEFYDSTKNLFFRQPAGFNVSLAHFASEDEAEKVRNLLLEGRSWESATSGDVVDASKVINVTTVPMFVPESVFDDYLAPMKSLDLGAVSPVFEVASSDFAVGVKDEAVAEKISPYDEVSGDIRMLLQQQKERTAMTNFSQGLLSRARIVIHDPDLFPPQRENEVLPVSDVPEPASAPTTDTLSDDATSADSQPSPPLPLSDVPLSPEVVSTEVVSRE